MTFEKLLKSRAPSFWSSRGRGLQIKHLRRYIDEEGDVNAKATDGWTLLHFAAEDQSIEAIQLLVSRGADVNAREHHNGYTPLYLAVDSDCDTSSRDGRRASCLPTVRALIECGADESICSNDGRAPRDLAVAYGTVETDLYDAVSRKHRAKCDLSGVPAELLTDVTPEAIDLLLSDWRWLMEEDHRALFLSASGDVFLMDMTGRVLWLNTGHGTITPLAGSLSEFESALSNLANRVEWFMAPVIERLRQAGKRHSTGQCYGFVILPILGGDWEGDNRVPISAKEHLSLTGYLHEKAKDLPDGTQVKIEFVD